MQTIDYQFDIVGKICSKLLMKNILNILDDYRYNTVITNTLLNMFSTVSKNLVWYENLDKFAGIR